MDKISLESGPNRKKKFCLSNNIGNKPEEAHTSNPSPGGQGAAQWAHRTFNGQSHMNGTEKAMKAV